MTAMCFNRRKLKHATQAANQMQRQTEDFCTEPSVSLQSSFDRRQSFCRERKKKKKNVLFVSNSLFPWKRKREITLFSSGAMSYLFSCWWLVKEMPLGCILALIHGLHSSAWGCGGTAAAGPVAARTGGPPACPLPSLLNWDGGKGKPGRKTIPCKSLKEPGVWFCRSQNRPCVWAEWSFLFLWYPNVSVAVVPNMLWPFLSFLTQARTQPGNTKCRIVPTATCEWQS